MNIKDILERLREPIPDNLIQTKKITAKSGKSYYEADFISWVNYCELLDNRCGLGAWEWKIKELNQIGNRLVLIGELTIYGDDRTLSMMASGCEDVDCSSFGDPSSNAESMALRRCCAKLGLSRDFWKKEDKKPNNNLSNTSTPKPLGKGEITREEWLRRKQAGGF